MTVSLEVRPGLRVIGAVEGVSTSGVARFVPLLHWYELSEPVRIGNPLSSFPSRGRVSWFHAPNPAQWTLWAFGIKENQTYDPENKKPDLFMTDGVMPVEDIVIGSFQNEEEARAALSVGIDLPTTPTKRSYVRVGTHEIIGPLDLSSTGKGTYAFVPETTHSQVAVFEVGEDDIVRLSFEQRQWSVLWPPGKRRRELSQVDWGSSEEVVRRALKVVARYHPAAIEGLQLTDRAIRNLAGAVSETNLTPVEAYRLQRATKDIHARITSAELVQKFSSEVLAFPAVSAILSTAREKAATEAREQALTTMSGEMEVHRQGMEKLRMAVQQLQAEQEALETNIRQLKTKQAAIASTLEPEIARAVERTKSAPGAVLADLVILEPFLRKIIECSQQPPVAAMTKAAQETVSPAEQQRPRSEYTTYTISDKEIAQYLDAIAFEAGVDLGVARRTFAALIAGVVPCLSGAASVITANAFSTWLFDGASVALALHPGILSVDQVLGTNGNSPLRQIESHTEGLLRLVMLEGVNRTMADAAVLPLLYAARPGNTMQYAFGSWPRDVLLMVTAPPSELGLPLPRRFWETAAFVYSDVPSGDSLQQAPAVRPGCIPTAVFTKSKSIATPRGNWRKWIDEKAQHANVTPPIARNADCMEQALRKIGADLTEAVAGTIECCLLPLFLQVSHGERKRALDFPGYQQRLFEAFAYLGKITS